MSFWDVKVDPVQVQRAQDAYTDLQGRLARERTACDAQAKDDATRRSLERAFGAGLTDMLRAYPDVFAKTRLGPATVEEWAARFAAQI